MPARMPLSNPRGERELGIRSNDLPSISMGRGLSSISLDKLKFSRGKITGFCPVNLKPAITTRKDPG